MQWISRLFMLAIAVALVLVPTMARARQRVEYRDATRLSIKHSWLGVAPPSKASVAPQPVVALPAIAAEPEPPRLARRSPVTAAPAPHSVPARSLDPLRGPPSLLLS
jgi:hypothetical protein